MDVLNNPWAMFSSLLLGTLGLALLVYAKKAKSIRCFGIGVVLSVAPYCTSSLAVMWGAAGATVLAMVLVPRSF